jgi:hypothetical protein
MLAGATDETTSERAGREEDVALLARFVPRASVVDPRLSVIGSSQIHSRTALRSCGKTRRQGYLGAFGLNSLGVAGTNTRPS